MRKLISRSQRTDRHSARVHWRRICSRPRGTAETFLRDSDAEYNALTEWLTYLHRACKRSVSGAWAERERSGKRSGAGRKSGGEGRSGAWSERGRKRWSGNGAWSGLNRPLTAHSNLTFHWLCNVYNVTHSTVYSLLFQSSLFYSSCTCFVTCSNPARISFTYNPAQGILNKTRSISSTWRVFAKCAVWTISKQDAQLSQRDRAAGCVIVFAKSRRLELEDNISRTL